MERDELDRTAFHFIALVHGKPFGAARATLKDGGASAKIGRVSVSSSMRGLGIGKQLIAAIEASANFVSVCNFVLDAQSCAIQFYLGLGYETIGEEFLDAGIPHRHMTKTVRRLDALIAQFDPAAPDDAELRDWQEAPPVGRELL
jgi:predicted GNAT family N-acyltransferase